MMAYYSFDFAQQVHFPSNPMQPGPIYFKTPRKCGVFGVMTEALPQMVLFLMDEAVETGKDANTVISLLLLDEAVETGKGANTVISLLLLDEAVETGKGRQHRHLVTRHLFRKLWSEGSCLSSAYRQLQWSEQKQCSVALFDVACNDRLPQ